jgi:DNA-binding NtrC family response regulator
MSVHILIVDDDPVQRRLLEAAVRRAGHDVTTADGGDAALAMLDGPRGRDFALVILDLMMPGTDGLKVLETMRARGINMPVIVQTAQGGIDTVITAMRAGAFDFVVKPVSPERLQVSIKNALRVEALEGEVKRIRRAAEGTLTFKDIVTNSPAMDRVIRLGQKAAASNIPILIEGETGVGKELIARAIQGSSERTAKPFVTVNCGAIPENLVESILFGHEKGAFTGATEKHTGKFVEAHTGTLFLDEIGDLPLEVQVKLLRAIQEGEIDPVGAKAPRKIDIRLISATHRDLLQQVKDGRFREDLFYRLNVFPIFVPPLRDRKEDIPHLVRHFAARFAAENGIRPVPDVSPQALRLLQAHDWPGNIRQLENAVFRAVVLADSGVLTPEEFPQIRAQVSGISELSVPATAAPEETPAAAEPSATAARGIRPGPVSSATDSSAISLLDEKQDVRPLAAVEEEAIRFAIEHYRGQMSQVARKLGIGRSTLYRKLKEYGIDDGNDSGKAIPEGQ